MPALPNGEVVELGCENGPVSEAAGPIRLTEAEQGRLLAAYPLAVGGRVNFPFLRQFIVWCEVAKCVYFGTHLTRVASALAVFVSKIGLRRRRSRLEFA